MRTACLLVLSFLVMFTCLRAEAVPEGTGLMYNADYGFWLTAPEGWTLDNSAPPDAGLCAMFYPNGSSWKDSPTIFYVNTKAAGKTIQEAVDEDLKDYHEHGSPHSKAEKVKALSLKDNREAVVWEYTGDQWNNCERVAMVREAKGISVMVLTARTKKQMEAAYPAFEQLVLSYRYEGYSLAKNREDKARKDSR